MIQMTLLRHEKAVEVLPKLWNMQLMNKNLYHKNSSLRVIL